MRARKAILSLTLAALAACSPAPPKSTAPQAGAAAAESKPVEPTPVKTAAAHPILFHGYACTEGCLSHQQGYSWASAHGITNPNDCRGTSETFLEGCKAFAGIEGPFGGRIIDQSFPHALGSD